MRVTKKLNGKVEIQNRCCREILIEFDKNLDIEVLNKSHCPHCNTKINFFVEEEHYDIAENM